MARRRYQQTNNTSKGVLAEVSTSTALPIDRPVAIYYRQSTDSQVGNISTSIQTVDMVAYLKHCGWTDEHILMIDMDAGVSGTTKIDERPGMSELFDLITSGQLGAVACQDEDRLFRDVTQIQVNIFIEACRSSQVLVLTPSMVYDFANPMTGTFHARQFRFKSEMAAEYINAVIRGKLHTAKRRMLLGGQWAGQSMPAGYMVDMRKTLPDGGRNEQWRKYAVFESYAEVIREYFRLFLSFAGNLRKTADHIREHGPYYPDPKACQPPEGYRVVYRIRKSGGKLCPGRTGLSGILTNAQYLGHWMYQGAIVQWHNHEAIIDEDTFMRAFNYLSPVSLDGRENRGYRGMKDNARPSREEKRSVERPLLSGMLVARDGEKWGRVGTYWVEKAKRYTYTMWSVSRDRYLWSKATPFVDEAVAALVREKLMATFDQEVWETTLAEFREQANGQQRQKRLQLSHLDIVMENLIVSLDTLTNPTMIRRTQERYEDAQAEYERLSAELAAMSDKTEQLKSLEKLRESCGPVLENWENMSRDENRVVLHAFIERIEAEPGDGHSLELTVHWRDETTDCIVLPRQATTGNNWLPEETEYLLELVESGASELEIARAFPTRTWSNIRNKFYRETGSGEAIRFKKKRIKDNECYLDYAERTGEDSLLDMSSVSCSGRARRDEPARSRPAGATRRRRPARHS